jgi:sporulation protein YlmC with PRC-barrel domain
MNTEVTISERTFLASEFFGRKIYTAQEGIQLGVVKDLMVSLDLLEVATIVTVKGDLVERDLSLIPSGEVVLWGQDLVLVTQVDVIKAREEMPDFDKWVSVHDDLIGEQIITVDGNRLGEVKDLLIGEQGRIEGYVIEEADHLPEQLTRSDGKHVYIPIIATHSLGSETLIINPANLTATSALPSLGK